MAQKISGPAGPIGAVLGGIAVVRTFVRGFVRGVIRTKLSPPSLPRSDGRRTVPFQAAGPATVPPRQEHAGPPDQQAGSQPRPKPGAWQVFHPKAIWKLLKE